jgi:hypothetical protein
MSSAAFVVELLAEHAVVRKPLGQPLPRRALGFAVGNRDR